MVSWGRRLPLKTSERGFECVCVCYFFFLIFFFLLFASPTTSKSFITLFELAPEQHGVLGKASVRTSGTHRSRLLPEVSQPREETHPPAGKP